MPPTLVPFTDDHLEEASALLAARHRADRAREPELPARFIKPTAAREALAAAWSAPMTEGMVALRGGRMTGYLLGSIVLPEPSSVMTLFIAPRAVQIADPGYAAEPGDAEALYRELYAALAPSWLRAGCFAHYVSVRLCDAAALEGWSSLGFGRQMVSGLRDVGPVEGDQPVRGVTITRAAPEDIEVVTRLICGNLRYHTAGPIFDPYFPEVESSIRPDIAVLLAEPNRSPVWLAEQDGRPAGILNLVQPRPRMTTPKRAIHLQNGYTEPGVRGGGVASALLGEATAWAREAGYERCTIHWHTANLLGARFWQRSGFRPAGYSLVRWIDERIAWAGLRKG